MFIHSDVMILILSSKLDTTDYFTDKVLSLHNKTPFVWLFLVISCHKLYNCIEAKQSFSVCAVLAHVHLADVSLMNNLLDNHYTAVCNPL